MAQIGEPVPPPAGASPWRAAADAPSLFRACGFWIGEFDTSCLIIPPALATKTLNGYSLAALIAERCPGLLQIIGYDPDFLKDCLPNTTIKETFDVISQSMPNTPIEFSVLSQKGGTDKVGSTTIHVPQHCSVRHPVVQMLLFAVRGWDSLYCRHPMVPRVIIDLTEKSSSDARGHTTKLHNGDEISHLRSHKNLDTYVLAIPGDDNRTPAFWLDSGAGHHAVGDASVLCNLRDPPDGTAVKTADGSQLPVTKIGDIRTDIFQIPEVYLVPGLQVNLISVRQLTKCKIISTFYENHAELYRDGEQVGGAIVDDDSVSMYRLYYLAAV